MRLPNLIFTLLTCALLGESARAEDKLCPCMERAIRKSEFRACYIESDLPVPPDAAFDLIYGSYMTYRRMYGHGPGHGETAAGAQKKTGVEAVSFDKPAEKNADRKPPKPAPLVPPALAPQPTERPTTVTLPVNPSVPD